MQIGGVTLGADPIVGGMVLYSYLNKKPMSGFIIRKEPKSHGLQKVIEGDFKPGQPLVLVDDIVNSGKNLLYALDVLKPYGCEICAIVSIINFKRKGYKKLQQNNVDVDYLFDLKDLYIENKPTKEKNTQTRWQLSGINKWPVAVPRSTPVLYRDYLLFGTNEGSFLCVRKHTGDVKWRKDLSIDNKKGILSSPCNEAERIYFGAYNGYLYCLDANDGNEIWKTKNCNWIGSSPCMDQEKIYVGIEYVDNRSSLTAFPKMDNNNICIGIGQRKEKGALCAYSKNSGKLLWQLETGHYIHSSPCVDIKRNVVIVGCNDGYIYAVNSDSGELSWKFNTGYPTRAGFAINEDTGYIYFGSENGVFYCLAASSGRLIWSKKIGSSIYNTPEIEKNLVIISTVSKRIFALDKFNGLIQWFYNTDRIIYSSTKTTDNKVYCGDNDGYLHVIDLKGGKLTEKYDAGNEILTKPVIEDGVAYLGCKGAFVCIDLK